MKPSISQEGRDTIQDIERKVGVRFGFLTNPSPHHHSGGIRTSFQSPSVDHFGGRTKAQLKVF